MKFRLLTLVVVFMVAVLSLTWIGPRGEQGRVQAELSEDPVIPKIALNINLDSDPSTLDPALASSSASIAAIDQLFVGLTKIDDDTGEVIPELAASWEITPDSMVYTFNLRDDVFWTDGSPVTAQDVHYGILRSLNPDTNSGYAPLLYLIENAQAYHEGEISDPNQVGIVVLGNDRLQIKLREPAAYLPAVLDHPVARPVPHQAIETWGENWTEPENIVTNGAYQLKEWVQDDHILMEKNLDFNLDDVQIEEINMSIVVDGDAAWQDYIGGEIDTVVVPETAIPGPIESQEIQFQYTGCTSFYGFVNNKPPFDDVRVRKAFAMSLNKYKIAALGPRTPANQFAPPSTWGAPEIGSVGLSFNSQEAQNLLQSYLSEKGMSLADFNAMDITLMYNTSEAHAAIAAIAQQEWSRNLGINVKVVEQPWTTYLQTIQKSTPLEEVPHIFRMGWCQDYPDENNWVHTFFNNQTGWNNVRRGCIDDVCETEVAQQFDLITLQAKSEQNPVVRKNLYFEAERILAEVEAAYIPLYFHGTRTATKAYLEKDSVVVSGSDIGNWQITKSDSVVEIGGGTVKSYDGNTTLTFPPGAYPGTTIVNHTPITGWPPIVSQGKIGDAFEISAVDGETGEPVEIEPSQTYTIVVAYDEANIGPVDESTLALYSWNGSSWVIEPSSIWDGNAHTVKASPDHMGQWAILGRTNRVFLPSIADRY